MPKKYSTNWHQNANGSLNKTKECFNFIQCARWGEHLQDPPPSIDTVSFKTVHVSAAAAPLVVAPTAILASEEPVDSEDSLIGPGPNSPPGPTQPPTTSLLSDQERATHAYTYIRIHRRRQLIFSVSPPGPTSPPTTSLIRPGEIYTLPYPKEGATIHWKASRNTNLNLPSLARFSRWVILAKIQQSRNENSWNRNMSSFGRIQKHKTASGEKKRNSKKEEHFGVFSGTGSPHWTGECPCSGGCVEVCGCAGDE